MDNLELKSYKREKTLKFYLVPVLTVILFFSIILFFIIPKISDMIDDLNIIEQNSKELQAQKTKIQKLNSLQEKIPTVNSYLLIIDSIAPTGYVELVSFRNDVTEFADEFNLDFEKQTLSENLEANIIFLDPNVDQNFIGAVGLQEVPSNFIARGKYADITNFLRSLSTLKDFIVVRKMDLNKLDPSSSQDVWVIELELVKYQFIDDSNEVVRTRYKSVPETANITDSFKIYLDSREVEEDQASF